LVASAPLPWLLLWASVLAAAVFAFGPQRLLASVCTTAMYGQGWPSFGLWCTAFVTAMPWRVNGAGWLRQSLHAGLWCLAWSWWLLALGLADLFARADLLWCAYLLVGSGILAWRLVIHDRVLRWLLRRALRVHPMSPGVLALGRDEEGMGRALPERSIAGRLLLALARAHGGWLRRTLHAAVFGPTGLSRMLLTVAMQETDRRAASLREALRLETVNCDELAAGLASAHLCETRLVLARLRHAEEVDVDHELASRSLAVVESMALASLRSPVQAACATFAETMTLGAEAGALSPGVPTALRIVFAAKLEKVEHVLGVVVGTVVSGSVERALLDFSTCLMLCRHRLYRPAMGLLGEIAKRAAAEVGGQLPDTSVARIAHAVTSEIELQAAMVEPVGDGSGDDHRDVEILARRQGLSGFHGRVGRHPRFGRQGLVPSSFASFPPPRRPREIGMGLCAVLGAGAFATVLWWPYQNPLPGRLHEVRDVPFGGPILSLGVQTAAVAGKGADHTVLLPDAVNGVRGLHLQTLSLRGEGGTGSALDGTVQKIVSNADGTALALFSARVDGSSCVSVRDLDGIWRPVIAPAELKVGGDEIDGAIDGLPMPVLYRAKNAPRLLVYNSGIRALGAVRTLPGSATIRGEFVAAAADRTSSQAKRAFVLTKGEGGGVFRLSAVDSDAALQVDALGAPAAAVAVGVLAVGPGGDGEALAVDGKGRAWRSTDQPGGWVQLRAGAQDLRLDRVDAAAITEQGSRMWLVREGIAWTRILPPPGEAPVVAQGWATCKLPTTSVVSGSERLIILDTAGKGDVVVIRTAGATSALQGYAERLKVTNGSVTPSNLLQAGDRLIDFDASGTTVLLWTVGPDADGARPHRIELLDLGTKQGSSVAERRQPIRIWTEPVAGNRARLDEPVLAIGVGNPHAIALFRDGRFLRFDPRRDQLLPATTGGSAPIGNVPLRAGAIDAAIDAATTPPIAFALAGDGRIESLELSTTKQSEPRLLVDPTKVVPVHLLAEATHAVASAQGVVLSAPGCLWRLDLADAADLWTDMSEELGGSKQPAALSFDSSSAPLLAWSATESSSARIFRQGVMHVVRGDFKLMEPGLGQPYFARAEAGGTIHALGSDGSRRTVLPRQKLGPTLVREATIRAATVDFLGQDRLHSVTIPEGEWSASDPVDGEPRLGVVETARGESVLVVPRSRAGISYATKPGEGADTLAPLGRGIELRSVAPMSSGVVGLDANHDIRWLDAMRTGDTVLKDRTAVGIDLATVDEALGHELADRVAIFLDRTEGTAAGPAVGTQPGGCQAEGHVGVLGIGEDEVATAPIGRDPGEFHVERFRRAGHRRDSVVWGGSGVAAAPAGAFRPCPTLNSTASSAAPARSTC
jgi:hypothetical protein